MIGLREYLNVQMFSMVMLFGSLPGLVISILSSNISTRMWAPRRLQSLWATLFAIHSSQAKVGYSGRVSNLASGLSFVISLSWPEIKLFTSGTSLSNGASKDLSFMTLYSEPTFLSVPLYLTNLILQLGWNRCTSLANSNSAALVRSGWPFLSYIRFLDLNTCSVGRPSAPIFCLKASTSDSSRSDISASGFSSSS